MLFEGAVPADPVNIPQLRSGCRRPRFLMLKSTEQAGAAPTQINVVLNWFEELKRRVPTGTK